MIVIYLYTLIRPRYPEAYIYMYSVRSRPTAQNLSDFLRCFEGNIDLVYIQGDYLFNTNVRN